jgi:hypothetical protein
MCVMLVRDLNLASVQLLQQFQVWDSKQVPSQPCRHGSNSLLDFQASKEHTTSSGHVQISRMTESTLGSCGMESFRRLRKYSVGGQMQLCGIGNLLSERFSLICFSVCAQPLLRDNGQGHSFLEILQMEILHIPFL